MSFYCRVFRTTFLNDFQRESAESFLSPKVAAEDYKRGLISRITFNTSQNQRVEIYLWPDRETADKTWREFGEPLSHKVRETGARMERFEGYVDNFDVNPSTDFNSLITEFETKQANKKLPAGKSGTQTVVSVDWEASGLAGEMIKLEFGSLSEQDTGADSTSALGTVLSRFFIKGV